MVCHSENTWAFIRFPFYAFSIRADIRKNATPAYIESRLLYVSYRFCMFVFYLHIFHMSRINSSLIIVIKAENKTYFSQPSLCFTFCKVVTCTNDAYFSKMSSHNLSRTYIKQCYCGSHPRSEQDRPLGTTEDPVVTICTTCFNNQ
jgi:hypothetical protein